MKARELDHIRFVASHFNGLQGLRYWVPLGLITLSLGGTTYFESVPFRVLRAVLFLGAILLAFAARRYYQGRFGEVEPQSVFLAELESLSVYSPAGSPSRLGGGFQDVKPAIRLFSATMGAALAILFTIWLLSPSVSIEEDESLLQPSMSAVYYMGPELPSPESKALLGHFLYGLFGSFFLAVWLWRERHASQSHYLAFGLLLLGLSVAGASLGWIITWKVGLWSWMAPPLDHLWIALLLCGVLTVVAGLLDHRQLSRMLEGPAAVEEHS